MQSIRLLSNIVALKNSVLIALFQVLFLGVFFTIENELLPISILQRRFLGLVFLGFVGSSIGLVSLIKEPKRFQFLKLGLFASFVFIFGNCQTQFVMTTSFIFCLVVLNTTLDESYRSRNEPILVALFVWFVLSTLPSLVPELGRYPDRMVEFLLNRQAGESSNIWYTWKSIGGPVLGFVFLYSLFEVFGRSFQDKCFGVAGILISVATLFFLPTVLHENDLTIDVISKTSLCGFCVVSVWLFFREVFKSESKTENQGFISSGVVGWFASIFLFFNAVAVPLFLIGLSTSENSGKVIKVYNHGGIDWHRDSYSNPRNGMFGNLPVVARKNGYQFDVINEEIITEEELAETQVLIMVNCPKLWSAQEKAVIRSFVSNGGSLVVLGDHTDVFGIMNGLNDLLKEYGFEFLFDSAYPMREGWKGCISASPDYRYARQVDSAAISIGASLKLHGGARPLFVGEYGHSDIGVRENVMGSFLGNYHYDKGEQAGDVTLVGTKNVGDGRVVVFGDTSIFQGSLAFEFESYLAPLFDQWLSQVGFTEREYLRFLVAITSLCSLSLIYFLARETRRKVLAIGAYGFVASTVFTTCWEGYCTERMRETDRNSALILDSQINSVGHYDLRLNSIGSLYTHLSRGGFDIASVKNWDSKRIQKAGVLVFIAPRKKLNENQVSQLMRFQNDGGIVLLCSGFESASGCRQLLEKMDLKIVNRPLGTVELRGKDGKKDKSKPRFLDAWAIEPVSGKNFEADPAIDILFSYGKEVCALFKKKGKGGLLLISDTRFFSSSNVEDRVYGFNWPGNQKFIRGLFAKYLHSNENVFPVFKSPKMPK